jgi:hypothetical protein
MYEKKIQLFMADYADDYLGKRWAQGFKPCRKRYAKRLLKRKLRRNQAIICKKELLNLNNGGKI